MMKWAVRRMKATSRVVEDDESKQIDVVSGEKKMKNLLD